MTGPKGGIGDFSLYTVGRKTGHKKSLSLSSDTLPDTVLNDEPNERLTAGR
jgi:hypothetical protein